MTEIVDLTKIKERRKELVFQINLLYNIINTETKTGRNNLCFCGSGKKFKKCCLLQHIEKLEKLNELMMNLSSLDIEFIKLEKENIQLKVKNESL